jgi:hypothetical protein
MHSSIGYFYSSIDHWHGGLENPPSYERRALIDDPAGEVYSERMSVTNLPEFMRGLAVAAVLGGFSNPPCQDVYRGKGIGRIQFGHIWAFFDWILLLVNRSLAWRVGKPALL